MDSIVGLGNGITYNFVAPGATKSHMSSDNIVSLENRITYEIMYDFRGDRTTDMRPPDNTASTKMYPIVYISVLDWKLDDRHEIMHHWYMFLC